MGHRSAHAISRRTAANLLRDTRFASSVYRETVEITRSTEPVIKSRAKRDMIAAGVYLKAGDLYYLVQSKCYQRYFVVYMDENHNATCSIESPRLIAACLSMIGMYEIQHRKVA